MNQLIADKGDGKAGTPGVVLAAGIGKAKSLCGAERPLQAMRIGNDAHTLFQSLFCLMLRWDWGHSRWTTPTS